MDPNAVITTISQSADANSVLAAVKDVQQFYQDSFSNLLWTMGIIITIMLVIVGVVMPLYLEWSRSRSFKKTEKKLLDKFENDIKKAKADFKAELTQTSEQLKKEAKENVTRLEAKMYMTEAFTLAREASQPARIALLSLRAAKNYAKLQNSESLYAALNMAEVGLSYLMGSSASQREVNDLLTTCGSVSDELTAQKLDPEYLKRVTAMETTIGKIQLKPEPSK